MPTAAFKQLAPPKPRCHGRAAAAAAAELCWDVPSCDTCRRHTDDTHTHNREQQFNRTGNSSSIEQGTAVQ